MESSDLEPKTGLVSPALQDPAAESCELFISDLERIHPEMLSNPVYRLSERRPLARQHQLFGSVQEHRHGFASTSDLDASAFLRALDQASEVLVGMNSGITFERSQRDP